MKRSWWSRNRLWVMSPLWLGAAWAAFVLYRGVQVYARNQGSPWNNFDADRDGRFTRAEVEDLYGMDDRVFVFCDEDGDGLLTRSEYEETCSRRWVDSTKAAATRKAARALFLLENPSQTSYSILGAYASEDGKIYREAVPLFWETPAFSRFGLDKDGDGVISEPELQAALALPPPEKPGFLARLAAGL
ncbi:MAG: EF-hand domain-containing protein [Elusimicrobiales bacterium]